MAILSVRGLFIQASLVLAGTGAIAPAQAQQYQAKQLGNVPILAPGLTPSAPVTVPPDVKLPEIAPAINVLTPEDIKRACTADWVDPAKFAAVAIRFDKSGKETVGVDVAGDYLRHPASLTKIMTLMLAFEAIDNKQARLTDKVVFSPLARRAPPVNLSYQLRTLGRHWLTLEQTLKAAGSRSANDAAMAIAEHIGGSVEKFVALMNARAKALGMTRTVFKNPSGLPHDEQVTTAHDMALLVRHVQKMLAKYQAYLAVRHVSFGKGVAQTKMVKAKRGKRSLKVVFRPNVGVNGHLNLLEEQINDWLVNFGKTGFINKSGFNVAVGAVGPGKSTLVAVVMGGKTGRFRDDCARAVVSHLKPL